MLTSKKSKQKSRLDFFFHLYSYVLMFKYIYSCLMTCKTCIPFQFVCSWTVQPLGFSSLSVKWNELFCNSYLRRKLFKLSLASVLWSPNPPFHSWFSWVISDQFLFIEWGNHQMKSFHEKHLKIKIPKYMINTNSFE